MNAPAKVETFKPFNALAAYEAEREYSRKLERALSDALGLLDMECGRRALRGEDVESVRKFISDRRKVFGQ
jgi:hypothetical protein